MISPLCFILIPLVITPFLSAASEDEIVRQLTNPSKYNAKVRPEGYQVADIISAYVRNIDYVDDIKREYLLQVTIQQEWKDSRFNVSDAGSFPAKGYVTITDSSLIWTPDISISNKHFGSKRDVLGSNEMIRIYPNGEVMYSAKIALVMSCKMDFKYFPHDNQACKVRLESTAHTDDELHLEWRMTNPIEVNPNIEIPLFTITNVAISASHTIAGSFSAIDMTISFCRTSDVDSLVKVYIPSTFLVIIAYFSLWTRDIRIRYLISLLTLLVAIMMVVILFHQFPATSYSKLINVWLGVFLKFIFLVFIIHGFMDAHFKDGERSERHDRLIEYDDNSKEEGQTVERGTLYKKAWRHGSIPWDTRSKVLFVAKVAYPVAYALFVAIYTIVCKVH